MTMTNPAVISAIAVDVAADNALAARMVHPRSDVASALRIALEKGLEIRSQRIRYQEDLDEARTLKLKWTAATIELLSALFDNSSVADYCNDWVGKIFPEYAEFGNFIDQFYEEMEHRLAKLRSVLQRVEQLGSAAAPEEAAALQVDARSATPADTAAEVEAMPAIVRVVTAPTAAAPSAASRVPVTTTLIALLGADPADPAHAAVASLLKRMDLTPRPVVDPLAAGAMDAAVFILPAQSPEPAAIRTALYQLGCAVGRLGTNRVCVLCSLGSEPLRESGLEHIPLDAAGAWHLQLARHLKQAGIGVDMNKLC